MSGITAPSEDFLEAAIARGRSENSSGQTDDTKMCPPGSSLPLTLKQVNDLVTYITEEIPKIEGEAIKWQEERDHHLQEHSNDFMHRKQAGTIYEKSNISFNQSRRNTMPIIARLIKDYLGTDPFYAIEPITKYDVDQSKNLQDWAGFKLNESNLRSALMEAIEMANVVGEQVVKITHKDDSEFYFETDTVLVGPDNQPVMTQYGDPVYHDDEWIYPNLDPEDAGMFTSLVQRIVPNLPNAAQSFLQMAFPDQTIQVLRKDPNIQMPIDPNFQKMTYPIHRVHYSGPEICGIHHRDFVCPLNVPDIQDAHFVGHKFDLSVEEIVERFCGPDIDQSQFTDQEKEFYTYLVGTGSSGGKLDLLKSETSSAKSSGAQPNKDTKEKPVQSYDKHNNQTLIIECYLKIDPIGDGRLREITISIAMEHKFALTWDYTANIVAPEVRRPFRIVRTNPIANRWYGDSEYRLGAHKQEFIDWCFNRIIYDNAVSGQFRFYKRGGCEGWDTQPPRSGDQWNVMLGDVDPEKVLKTITMPSISDNTFQLMQSMMQAGQAESGNLSPGGDTLAQLPSSKLKYGIQAVERSGDEAYALKAIRTVFGIQGTVEAAIYTAIAYMQPTEEYTYSESLESKIGIANRTEIQEMKFRVKLEMTLNRGDQLNEQNEQATNIVLSYVALPPPTQKLIRDFLIERLKSLDIADPEKSLPEVTDQDIANYQQQQALQAQQEQAAANPPAKPTQATPPGSNGSSDTPPAQPIKV